MPDIASESTRVAVTRFRNYRGSVRRNTPYYSRLVFLFNDEGTEGIESHIQTRFKVRV